MHNLSFNIINEEMHEYLTSTEPSCRLRVCTNKDTRGTIFIVYKDIYASKTGMHYLQVFNVTNRYLIVLYYEPTKISKKFNQKLKEREITRLYAEYRVGASVSSKDM